MLELRPNCELCDVDLPPDSPDARICTYECTFCASCVETVLHDVCPNCGGNFQPRSIRPARTWREGTGLDAVMAHIRPGETCVLIGSSGVGKSTLVNALVPGSDRTIGHVNAVTGRGRHTSTSALMLPLPPVDGSSTLGADDTDSTGRTGGMAGVDGWIIDTPGIRSFGLAHVQPGQLIGAFPDLEELTDSCPRGCTHGEDEPECGLDEAVADGRTEAARVDSFRRLLASREHPEDY